VATQNTVPNLTLSQDARLYKYVRLPSGWKYLRADYSENFGLKPHSVFLPKTNTPTIVEGGKYVASDGGKWHQKAALIAGVQTAGAGSMAERNENGVWKSGKQRTLPTFPHPQLRRAEIYLSRCATLTISLVQKIGQASCFRVSTIFSRSISV
jgi:hypothetical protein